MPILEALYHQLEAHRLRSAAALLERLQYEETAHFLRVVADLHESGKAKQGPCQVDAEFAPLFDADVHETCPHARPTQYGNFIMAELLEVLSRHPAHDLLEVKIRRAPGMKTCPVCKREYAGYAACPDCMKRGIAFLGTSTGAAA